MFAVVLNNYERRFVSTPQFLSLLYKYFTKKYPYIYHIRVVDDEVFKFLHLNDDVQITAYS